MTYLRFRDDLVDDVVERRKWLTARYRLERSLQPGDVVLAIDESGEAFAEIAIVLDAPVFAFQFIELVDLVGGHRRYQRLDELLEELDRCYDTPPADGWGPRTLLRAVLFRLQRTAPLDVEVPAEAIAP